RTVWRIVSSCLTTIFACTWVAVHPNIPSPYKTNIQITLHQIRLMLITLIALELIIVWVMKQWFVSLQLAKYHADDGWTQTHSFFTLMGGFMQVEVRGRQEILLGLVLPDIHNGHDRQEYLLVSETQIQDRSKCDALSKSLVLLQTSWFILQCIAHAIEGLPITPLEITTLAFTILNLATFRFWWNKPADLRC
ncbi:hypothetical protein JAAARDRAFT_114003, partial [Jaapia argillacea MUCL 33604]